MSSKDLKRLAVFAIPLLVMLQVTAAYSLPEVDEVVSGDVEINIPDANTMVINAGDNAIINYSSFDIMEHETVQVTLPTSSSEILNRVSGIDSSDIFGYLTCNGRFILVNPNGIYIGTNAVLDTNSLILSTRDIQNQDFLDKEYLFQKLSPEQLDMLLVNAGTINLEEGGFGVLIAGAIENEGTIIAPIGKVALASGDAVRLNLSQDGLISVVIKEEVASTIVDREGNPITDAIRNTGSIEADGGTVLLASESLPDIFEHAVNLEGYISAQRVDTTDGIVRILADDDIIVACDITAARIEIGDATVVVPENVVVKGPGIVAQDSISILANNNIDIETSLSSLSGDITLFADYDGNGEGEFTHTEGLIETSGAGNITIDGSETMTLGSMAVEDGVIRIGTVRAPVSIAGSPSYTYKSGDIDIISQYTVGNVAILETERGDVLRYDPQGYLALCAPQGEIRDHTGTPLTADYLSLTALGVYLETTAPEIILTSLIEDLYVNSSIKEGDIITIEANNINISYPLFSDLTIEAEGSIDTDPAVLLQANTLTLISNKFGTYTKAIKVDASQINLHRLSGQISIAESLGLGTSILMRGPPEGFGGIE